MMKFRMFKYLVFLSFVVLAGCRSTQVISDGMVRIDVPDVEDTVDARIIGNGSGSWSECVDDFEGSGSSIEGNSVTRDSTGSITAVNVIFKPRKSGDKGKAGSFEISVQKSPVVVKPKEPVVTGIDNSLSKAPAPLGDRIFDWFKSVMNWIVCLAIILGLGYYVLRLKNYSNKN